MNELLCFYISVVKIEKLVIVTDPQTQRRKVQNHH